MVLFGSFWFALLFRLAISNAGNVQVVQPVANGSQHSGQSPVITMMPGCNSQCKVCKMPATLKPATIFISIKQACSANFLVCTVNEFDSKSESLTKNLIREDCLVFHNADSELLFF